MLRPERMSKVSVTGSKTVLDDVIDTVHELNLLHVTDYDGSWEGFEPGNPIEGAEQSSEKLVTVRSLESMLDLEPGDARPSKIGDDEALAAELESIRTEVTALDDRRSELESELDDVLEELDQIESFVDLGIDLDLLGGYDSLQVQVGEANEDAVREVLDSAEAIEAYEAFAGEDVVAVFAYPADQSDANALEDALVGVEFATIEIPDATGNPNQRVEDLLHRREQLSSQLEGVENEIQSAKIDAGGFILAAEEELTIDVQKREVPLNFATTDRAFVAEGWVPTKRYGELEAAIETAVGDHADVEELERATYGDSHREHVSDSEPTSGGQGQGVASDGGVVESNDKPPVIQDNAGPVKPFEALVEIINRPKYSELDPTIVLFLTFPAFFGFMIGDLGYGILYMGLGYWLVKSFDSDVIKAMGGIGLWAGAFTAVFGVLYGEFFGLHQLGEIVWGGNPPIHKGLQPHYIYYAYAWLLVSVIVGVFHLVLGRVLDFYNNLTHGFREAFLESGSWIILTLGMWWWVFTLTATGPKPDFMFSVFGREGLTNPVTGETIEHVALPLGFTGFPVYELFRFDLGGFTLVVGAALATLFVGLALVIAAEGAIGLIESITQAFGHVVSYTRIAAVLLAKAGMALVVNLLVFGATLEGGEFHFIYFMDHAPNPEFVVFGGLVNGEGALALILGWIAGVLLLVFGHLLVLVLGVTSAGLQAVRLEYVEFFGKFYEGGGAKYHPFGYDSSYTTEE